MRITIRRTSRRGRIEWIIRGEIRSFGSSLLRTKRFGRKCEKYDLVRGTRDTMEKRSIYKTSNI